MMKIHLYKSIGGYMATYSIIWKQSQSDHETTRQERKQDNNLGFLLNADLALFYLFISDFISCPFPAPNKQTFCTPGAR